MLPLLPSDPTDVGGMTLVARLGVGGMGVVYLARQGDGEVVALKVIRPDLTADPQFRSRFTQEVRHALQVRGPFLAEAREASTSLTPQFIAWVYVPGEDLGRSVRNHGSLLAGEVAALAAALADSLGRLHGAGVVHRDVKPSNIQMGPNGPVLLDLGISRGPDSSSLTAASMSIGTPAWMSPEQWLGTEHGPAGDIWSWGAVVAFAAGGAHPFGSGTGEALGYRILHESAAVPTLSEPLRGLVAASLQRVPERRPGWREILEALGTSPSTVSAYVEGRWGRLGQLALAPPTSDDTPTVLAAGAAQTQLAQAPTRLQSATIPDWPHTAERRRIVAAGFAALLLLVVGASALLIGRAASAPADQPTPSASMAAHSQARPAASGTPPVETQAPSTDATAAEPTRPSTKVHGKHAKKPAKNPNKGKSGKR